MDTVEFMMSTRVFFDQYEVDRHLPGVMHTWTTNLRMCDELER